MRKLLGKHGETLTEALISVLIIALSAAMLATMVSAAVNINTKTNAATEKLYTELSVAESGSIASVGSVTINGTTVDVVYYGEGGGALSSYVKEDGAP